MSRLNMTTIDIPSDAIYLINIIQQNGYQAYLVGGCVRDIIMDKVPHDYDICTNANPQDIVDLLSSHSIRYGTVGITFGTVVAYLYEEYEITTFREDKAFSGKHRPDEVYFSSNIDTDLSRRDFTINAIALNPINGELIDIHNGQKDIKHKIIKAVGNADLRMKEDPLRILRAIRFAIALGCSIDKNTQEAMRNNKELLINISKERITAEFRKILTSGKPIKSIFLRFSDIITEIIPEMSNCVGFDQHNRYHMHNVYEHILYVVDYCDTTDFEIKMAALLHDIAKPEAYTVDEQGFGHFYGHPAMSRQKSETVLLNDFRLTYEETCNILDLIEYHDNDIKETRKTVKRFLNKIGPKLLEKWFILKHADRTDHIYPDHKHDLDIPKLKELYKEIMEEEQCFTLKSLNISGNDIMDLFKIKPGKTVGNILNKLLDEVIAEEIENENEQLKVRAIQIYKEINNE